MTLAVRSARLCLDCDILSDSPTCPVCGRSHTFPLAVWMRPLETELSILPLDGIRARPSMIEGRASLAASKGADHSDRMARAASHSARRADRRVYRESPPGNEEAAGGAHSPSTERSRR